MDVHGDEGGSSTKRKVPPSLQVGSDSDDEDKQKEKRLKVNSDNCKCSICLNVWHDVVSLTPCQHNFCNGCFSQWLKSSNGRGCKCPECRVDVLYASRNHALRSLVEDLLASDATLKRPAEEINKLDKAALINSNFMKISDINIRHTSATPRTVSRPSSSVSMSAPSNHRNSSIPTSVSHRDSDDEDEDEDEDDEEDDEYEPDFIDDGPQNDRHVHGRQDEDDFHGSDNDDEDEDEEELCLQCTSNPTSFTCSPSTRHATCSACLRKFPLRDPTNPDRCVVCHHVFCDRYWRSQNLAGCIVRLQPICERQLTALPSETHSSNTIEQQYTKEYIDQHGLTIEDVVKEWMAKVDAATISLSNMRVSSTSPICDNCSNLVVAQLLDKFRMSIPKSELPPNAAQRDDCWYGYACRTQKRQPHAAKLNHMCEPTSDKVVLQP